MNFANAWSFTEHDLITVFRAQNRSLQKDIGTSVCQDLPEGSHNYLITTIFDLLYCVVTVPVYMNLNLSFYRTLGFPISRF